MSIVKSLFFVLIFLIIKLGDAVLRMVGKTTHVIKASRKNLREQIISLKKTKKGKKRSKKYIFENSEHILYSRPQQPSIHLPTIPIRKNLQRIWSALRSVAVFITKIITLSFIRVPVARFFASRSNRKRKKHEKTRYKPSFFYKFKFFFLGAIVSFLFIFLPLLVTLFIADLPNPENLSVHYIPKTTKIYDRNDKLLYEIYANQNRTLVKLPQIPKYLRDATIAIEDKDFYTHPGFDVRGITRAFISNIQKNDLQGGSTITQQLVKSALLTPEPNIMRKVKEVVLAFWAERLYAKNQILELYFNYVPYGGTAWGIEAASEVYFGKSVAQLTLAESAFLAGLPRAPSIYSPYSGQKDLWKKRQKEVLDAMQRVGYIASSEAKAAYEEPLSFKGAQIPIHAPHFVMYVRDLLIQQYGLSEVERGGLQVKTSIDLSLQEEVEKMVAEQVARDSYLNIQNGAALVTNPKTGEILAMVGSKNYFDQEGDGNVNISTALRQPGSTVKIVTYSLALSSGFTEGSIIEDSPLTISNQWETYTPVNYDGTYHGKLPLRLALANSLNIPAVKITQKLGVENLVKFGREMGISSWTDASRYGVSLTLGGGEVTMLDMATVFGTAANLGKKAVLNPVLEVKDTYGKPLAFSRAEEKQVVDPGVAFIVSDILSDNAARSMAFGPSSPLTIPGHRVSVKTGTTDNKRDNWTIGFTPDVVVTTWVGNNDNSPMSPYLTSGITGAAPLWNRIMTNLISNQEEKPFTVPASIVKRFCLGRDMYFVRGTENTPTCTPTGSIKPIVRPAR